MNKYLTFVNISLSYITFKKKSSNYQNGSINCFFFGKSLLSENLYNPLRNQYRNNSRNHFQNKWVAVFGPGGGFFGVGTSELVVIGVVAWLVLGPKRLYQLARDIGKISGEIKNVAEEARQTFQQAIEVENSNSEKKTTDNLIENYSNKNTEKKNTPRKKNLMNDLDDLVKTEISILEKKKNE